MNSPREEIFIWLLLLVLVFGMIALAAVSTLPELSHG